MKITKTKEQIFKEEKPRYNAYQGGNGIIISEKYKGRKSKSGQKIKKEMKEYY